jgi:cytochrome c oxidase cbb3-type subunit IV
MTYETIATISQVSSLLLFIALFVGVLVYAVWPRNKPRFEDAQRRALDLDQSDSRQRGQK